MDKHKRAPSSEWVELRLGVSKMKVVANSHYHKFILGHISHKISNAKIFTLLVTRVLGPAGGSCPFLELNPSSLLVLSLTDFACQLHSTNPLSDLFHLSLILYAYHFLLSICLTCSVSY